ncbi:MAG: maltokinase N-terminal cap-like domain-containing protein [Nocardioidaceae bacterium]
MTDVPAAYLGQVAGYLERRRWFAGKGRDFEVTHIHAMPWLGSTDGLDGWPRVRIEIVTVAFADGSEDTYQLPVGYLREADPTLEHALVGTLQHSELGDVVCYDAVFLRDATARLFEGFIDGRRGSEIEFHVVDPEHLPDSAPVGAAMSAEQSNTSIVYGEDSILKLFRRVGAGNNPDIEIHAALTRAGSVNVAPLLGWISGRWWTPQGEPRSGDLAMLQVFLRTATDGWELALTSVRDLLVEADLHPEDVGGDLAGESERLGDAVAVVHRELAAAFATTSADGYGARLADEMQRRLDDAAAAVPELPEFRDALHARFERLRSLTAPVALQRVHGDLHLGQTMRTVKGWKVIDFEGEPGRAVAERAGLSSPLRDVAGMLRSFDYAAGATLQGFGSNPQLAYRAQEWSTRNRSAFLSGYAMVDGAEVDADSDLLAAFEADKAVYEAVYETRNRPGWLDIPMQGIARMAAEE